MLTFGSVAAAVDLSRDILLEQSFSDFLLAWYEHIHHYATCKLKVCAAAFAFEAGSSWEGARNELSIETWRGVVEVSR